MVAGEVKDCHREEKQADQRGDAERDQVALCEDLDRFGNDDFDNEVGRQKSYENAEQQGRQGFRQQIVKDHTAGGGAYKADQPCDEFLQRPEHHRISDLFQLGFPISKASQHEREHTGSQIYQAEFE